MPVPTPVVVAQEVVRKMRGGSRAHLIVANDGRQYVVKFLQNPQGHRILPNERLATFFLTHLGIATPDCANVAVDAEFLRRYGDILPGVLPGLHSGSCHPAPVGTDCPVYDFFPDALLPDLANVDHFHGALVFDQWISNADGRQAIFFRGRVVDPAHPRSKPLPAWVAQMIDSGHALQGPDWKFRESAIQGVYARLRVYGPHPSINAFLPWLEKLLNLRSEDFEAAFEHIPPTWIQGEEEELRLVLRRLDQRRAGLRTNLTRTVEWIRNRIRDRRAEFPEQIPPVPGSLVHGDPKHKICEI